ncbi:MAG TPA: GGDEF domain-containing protein [Candidatus Acidoferrales bacterium]|nr:GGDEF domain-containing protein [Candidatus Acidoferrales bacterium]
MGARGVTEVDREAAAYADRIRRANMRLAFIVAVGLAILAFLPLTAERDRSGVLASAAGLFALAFVWFVLVPPTAFGARRVFIFGVLSVPVATTLVALTGAGGSAYFPFLLLPVLTTVYALRESDGVVIGVLTAAGVVAATVVGEPEDPNARYTHLATNLITVGVYVFFARVVARALRQARAAIASRAETLASERSDALRLASTDALTGLYNRRYVEDLLLRLVNEAQRGRHFTLLAFDVDGLKRVNDTYGHEAGDALIARVAEQLRLGLRGADVAARLGGDEFLAVLPGTRVDQARAVGSRIRDAVSGLDWADVGGAVSITYGAAEWHEGASGADVMREADADLYKGKRSRK